jgi:hypothetical protein
MKIIIIAIKLRFVLAPVLLCNMSALDTALEIKKIEKFFRPACMHEESADAGGDKSFHQVQILKVISQRKYLKNSCGSSGSFSLCIFGSRMFHVQKKLLVKQAASATNTQVNKVNG